MGRADKLGGDASSPSNSSSPSSASPSTLPTPLPGLLCEYTEGPVLKRTLLLGEAEEEAREAEDAMSARMTSAGDDCNIGKVRMKRMLKIVAHIPRAWTMLVTRWPKL